VYFALFYFQVDVFEGGGVLSFAGLGGAVVNAAHEGVGVVFTVPI
jgi:hypothetical protein